MRSVLAIGSHPDDIEMGCGGVLLKHVARGDKVIILVVTDGEAGPGDVRLRGSEQQTAAGLLGVTDVRHGKFPDGRVSNYELDLVHLVEEITSIEDVDLVYTHHEDDSHQDHRAVASATFGGARWVRSVLSYESPSSLRFAPTVFVEVADVLDRKLAALGAHATQIASSNMASVELVRSQATFRGHQARTSCAEAFIPHRVELRL